MPVPVLIGIPALIASIVSFASTIGAAIVAFVARRGIVNVLYLAGYLTALALFITFIDTQIDSVLSAISTNQFGSFVTSILPTSTPVILGIAFSADLARWLHDQSQAALTRKFQ